MQHNNRIHSECFSCTFLLYKLFPAGILSARSVSVALCCRTKEPASKPSLSLQGPRIHIPPQDAAEHRPKNKNTIRDKKKGRKENSEESRSGVLCLVEGGWGVQPYLCCSSIRPSPRGFPTIVQPKLKMP